MKIAFLTEKYTPDIGGLAISSERLTRLLASAGHFVHVFAPTTNLPVAETHTIPSNQIRVTRFGAHKRVDDTLVDWFELLGREHRREPFDLIHAYFLAQAGFVAAYAGKYLQLPSVVSARGNDLERAIFDPSRAAHVLYSLRESSAVTANARELVKKAQALVPGAQVTVIPNGIDAEHFKPLHRNRGLAESLSLINEGQADSSSGVIGFAGELREKKGLRPLLDVYGRITKKKPCTLLIVGDVRTGEDRQLFEDFKHAHPKAQIVVTGFVLPRDLPSYYTLMDVFVHPSLRDGLPNALLEAMACEKAIVAAPVGGITDAVSDGVNGRLVGTQDVQQFAASVEELLSDKEMRKKLGSAARHTIMENFTLQRELEMNLDIYRRLGLKL